MPRSTTYNFNNVGGPCDAVLASLNLRVRIAIQIPSVSNNGVLHS
jgi:hypothetical protein